MTSSSAPLNFVSLLTAPWSVIFSVTETASIFGADSLRISYTAFHNIPLHTGEGNGSVFTGAFNINGGDYKG
ncbi:hypothetical protein [Flocculibacter collagenilyticus]|uniref:hypothetical protein n=1 Tax=Flocculibacter collagenilyticus TaxID=2744479 RepID=UPI0018F2CD34|nr:hypothetical protein [Flocculibacter collagenilyticus]